MKIGNDDRKKLMIAGVVGFFALLALYPLYQDFFGGTTAPPPSPPVVINKGSVGTPATTTTLAPGKVVAAPPGFVVGQGTAEKVGSTSAPLDPTLHMEAMRVTESLVYNGTGRNIFAAGAAAVVVPVQLAVAKFPVRTGTPPPVQQIIEHVPQGPPPINLKFFGTATSANGTRRAFLLNGDDVFLATAGDVVQRRYRVISIAANTILIEDIPNTNRQTLPLMGN